MKESLPFFLRDTEKQAWFNKTEQIKIDNHTADHSRAYIYTLTPSSSVELLK